MQFRIAAVDLVSNTCFPALAADELGFFKAEGLDAHIELVAMFGATKALRDGTADAMIAGSVHDVLTEFPDWHGTRSPCALSQGTPWLLVVRADLKAERGDLSRAQRPAHYRGAGTRLGVETTAAWRGYRSWTRTWKLSNCPARNRVMSHSVSLPRAHCRPAKSMDFGPTPWAAKPRSSAARGKS